MEINHMIPVLMVLGSRKNDNHGQMAPLMSEKKIVEANARCLNFRAKMTSCAREIGCNLSIQTCHERNIIMHR